MGLVISKIKPKPIKKPTKLRNNIKKTRAKRGRKSIIEKGIKASIFDTSKVYSVIKSKIKRKTTKAFKNEKKFRYKNNVKSDDSKIEKWFLYARFNIRQYKKTDDKNSSYVITFLPIR